MKLSKRLTALLLVLALSLCLTLPAFAETDAEAADTESDTVTYTLENTPPGTTVTISYPRDDTVKYGDSFTISAEVSAPPDVQVSYQWAGNRYRNTAPNAIAGATEPELTIQFGNLYYPKYDLLADTMTFYGEYAVSITFAGQDIDTTVKGNMEVTATMDYIAAQKEMTVPHGSDVTIDARWDLPPGVEVSYQWRASSRGFGSTIMEDVTEPKFTLSPGSKYYPSEPEFAYFPAQATYGYIATFTVKNEQDEVVNTFTCNSGQIFKVTVEAERGPTFFEKMNMWFMKYVVNPLMNGATAALGLTVLSVGLFLPFTPVIFIAGWIQGFIYAIKNG